jgi:hypothetical protein
MKLSWPRVFIGERLESHCGWLMRGRKVPIILAVAVVLALLYAVPLIRVVGFPERNPSLPGCGTNACALANSPRPFYQSIMRYYVGFGAEYGSFGYWPW